MKNKNRTILFAGATFSLLLLATGSLAQNTIDSEDEESLQGWTPKCGAEKRADVVDCSMDQRVILKETGQTLVAVTIRIPGNTLSPAMMIQVPFGLFIPSGITLNIDNGFEQNFEIQTCDQNGCYMGTEISGDFLRELMTGQTLNVKVQNLNRDEINVPVPLEGFSVSYNKIN